MEKFGAVGEFLYNELIREYDVSLFPESLVVQWVTVEQLKVLYGETVAVAASLLLCKYPFQVRVSKSLLQRLTDEALAPAPAADGLSMLDLDRAKELNLFPVKPFVGAAQKANVFFSDVWTDLKKYYPHLAQRFRAVSPFMAGLTNDQAACCLVHARCLEGRLLDPVLTAVRFIQDPKGAKELSTIVKAIGANSTEIGGQITEVSCLLGRGVGNFDLRSDAAKRCQPASKQESLFRVDPAKLRPIVRGILEREIDRSRLHFPSDEDKWTSRWMWCVNGSHSIGSENAIRGKSVIPKKIPRAYRKMFAENLKSWNPDVWSGRSFFSASAKLEPGKVRPIYGGDSETYFAFEWLLRPVEDAWRGYRVSLDPGSAGVLGNINRMRKVQSYGGVNVMVDYDSFNEAHTTESMEVLFEELTSLVGYDPGRSRKIVSSFRNAHVRCHGEYIGKLQGTLMSGHRATTFVNSVLNEAYLTIAAPDLFPRLASIHVGDDGFIVCRSTADAAELMQAISRSGIKMNPAKQSVGYETAEFLRVAVGDSNAQGYSARSIASLINGNWVTERKLDLMESMNTLCSSAWSLANRARDLTIPQLFCSAAQRASGFSRDKCRLLLTGEMALGNGPVRGTRNKYSRLDIRAVEVPAVEDEWSEYNAYATEQYLSNHVSSVELQAQKFTGTDLVRVMKSASYMKGFAETQTTRKYFSEVRDFMSTQMERGITTVEEAANREPQKGALSSYPLLNFMRTNLKLSEVVHLLNMLAIPITADPEMVAWGDSARGVVVRGWLPRSDALVLGGRTKKAILHCTFPVYF